MASPLLYASFTPPQKPQCFAQDGEEQTVATGGLLGRERNVVQGKQSNNLTPNLTSLADGEITTQERTSPSRQDLAAKLGLYLLLPLLQDHSGKRSPVQPEELLGFAAELVCTAGFQLSLRPQAWPLLFPSRSQLLGVTLATDPEWNHQDISIVGFEEISGLPPYQ